MKGQALRQPGMPVLSPIFPVRRFEWLVGVEKGGHRWETSQGSMHEFGHVLVGVNEGV